MFGLLQYFNIQYMLSGKKRCLWFLDIFVFGLLLTVLSYALDFANTIHFFSQVGSKMRKPTHRKKCSRRRIVQEHRDNPLLNKKYTRVFQKTKVQVADPKILPFFPPSHPVVLVRYLQKPPQLRKSKKRMKTSSLTKMELSGTSPPGLSFIPFFLGLQVKSYPAKS